MDIAATGKICASAQTYAAGLSTNNGGLSAKKSSKTEVADKVSISSEGKTLSGSSGAESILGIPKDTPGANLLEKMENAGNKLLNDFNSKFRALLKENGIDTGDPIELDTSYDGSIIVTNNHHDKAAIEKILKENPDLCNEYRQVDGLLTLAAKAREALEFQKAYALDPDAALDRYGYLFNSKSDGKILISDKGADFIYSRVIRSSS